jgi:hypothetical protein
MAKGNKALTTKNVDTPSPPSGNGGGLLGTAPDKFTGERAKVKDFMCQFTRWWKLNDEKAAFAIPYKRVTLCISYMRGNKVEDWADKQQRVMDENVRDGLIRDHKSHWDDFKKAFEDTYTDTAEAL